MTRDISSTMQTTVSGAEVSPILFVKAEFDSGDLNLWSGIGSIDWNGDTWTGAGSLLKITPVEETTQVKASGASFQLSGISSAILTIALGEPYQGRPITMWFGAFDSNRNIIADPFKLFAGIMDVMEIERGGQTVTITVSAESRMIDLKKRTERKYTPEDQKAVYAGDTFFDYVAGLQNREIILGKV